MKKEKYFTLDSIEGKSLDMLRDVKEIRQKHALKFCSEHSVMLVLDMQRYFLEESSHAFVPSAIAVLPKVSKLVNSYYAKGLPVVFTRHINTESDAGMMSVWWRDLIRPENSASEIIGEIDLSNGIIVEKSQYDAFYETSLGDILRDKEIKQVVISGVMTNLCCETTARSAFVRGFEVFLVIDGTATYNEPLHRATLWNAAHGFAMPMLANEIITALDE